MLMRQAKKGKDKMFTKNELKTLMEGLSKVMREHENEYQHHSIPAKVFVKWHNEEMQLYYKLHMIEESEG